MVLGRSGALCRPINPLAGGTLDPDLAISIDAWPVLSAEIRFMIVGMAQEGVQEPRH